MVSEADTNASWPRPSSASQMRCQQRWVLLWVNWRQQGLQLTLRLRGRYSNYFDGDKSCWKQPQQVLCRLWNQVKKSSVVLWMAPALSWKIQSQKLGQNFIPSVFFRTNVINKWNQENNHSIFIEVVSTSINSWLCSTGKEVWCIPVQVLLRRKVKQRLSYSSKDALFIL